MLGSKRKESFPAIRPARFAQSNCPSPVSLSIFPFPPVMSTSKLRCRRGKQRKEEPFRWDVVRTYVRIHNRAAERPLLRLLRILVPLWGLLRLLSSVPFHLLLLLPLFLWNTSLLHFSSIRRLRLELSGSLSSASHLLFPSRLRPSQIPLGSSNNLLLSLSKTSAFYPRPIASSTVSSIHSVCGHLVSLILKIGHCQKWKSYRSSRDCEDCVSMEWSVRKYLIILWHSSDISMNDGMRWEW